MRVIKITAALFIALALCFSALSMTDQSVQAKSNTITSSGVTYPTHQYAGKGFWVKGIVRSSYRLIYVRCGVKTLSGKWVNGVNVTVNPRNYSYDLNAADSRIVFKRLKAGTYVYCVEARNTARLSRTLVNRRFTVSKIYGKKTSKPSSSLVKGTPVTLSGKVNSHFNISTIRVGITSTSGKWKKGYFVQKNPRSRSFNISKVDPYIKFGKLGTGTYKYRIWASDIYGKKRIVVSKKFKVVRKVTNLNSNTNAPNGNIRSNGFRLSYKPGLISAIGRQPVSGPCGQYAMAYCRAVLDGRFPLKSKYKSYYKQLYHEYGFGSHYAYWYQADGSPVWYSSNKSCYKAALKKIAYGRPCIINLHNKSTGNNHFVAVIGYRAGTNYSNVTLSSFIALDPGYGKLVYLKNMNYTHSDNPEAIFF